jgi:zinc transporter 13
MLTTFAIVLHEVPHEFADFAILIRSGFSKWSAIRAQILTTSIGLLGTIFALQTQHLKLNTNSLQQPHSLHSYVLPFTAGCFLHIALSSILPEIAREDNWRESLKQLLWIGMGISVMALVNLLVD